jgi:defect-in-organelle-trafficking protein DotC
MRPLPVVNRSMTKISVLLIGFFLLLPVSAALAAVENNEAATLPVAPPGEQTFDKNAFLQGMQAALSASGVTGLPPGAEPVDAKSKEPNLGSATDPNSTKYKVDQLAKKAIQQREGGAPSVQGDAVNAAAPPPLEIEALQRVNETFGKSKNLVADDVVSKGISIDMRKEAQKEAALSYGARGGLAKRNYQIMERVKGFDPALDRVFNFRALLIKAPSGLLIEPPIVKESSDALVITEGGDEAAVANEVFAINKRAKIVSAPRDWRHYLVQSWAEVPPPPRILWPKNLEEQMNWDAWVAEGWQAGIEQADQIFEENVNRIVADYDGMVRYKVLLAQGMISAPFATHEDRGVTGGSNRMRVGDSALRITGPSQFLTKAELWKPADR